MLMSTLVILDKCQLWTVARTEYNLSTAIHSSHRAGHPVKPHLGEMGLLSLRVMVPQLGWG